MATHPGTHRAAAARTTAGDWWRFVTWAAAGVIVALGSVSWLGPGPIFGLAALVALIVLAATRRLHRPAYGLLGGAGIVALVIAWLNRQGPGTVYWHTATASGADQYPDPRPWLVAGVLLVAAGLLGFFLAPGTYERSPEVERRA